MSFQISTKTPNEKTPSVSSDQYDCLKPDNSYINTEDRQGYINPIPDNPKLLPPMEYTEPKLPPSRTFDRAPPPPSRDISISSGTGSDDAFKMSPVSPDENKNVFPNNVGKKSSKTKIFRKTPPQKEMGLLKVTKSSESDIGQTEKVLTPESESKAYDYADYGHQYEELPNRKSIAKCPVDNDFDARSTVKQSLGETNDTVSETGDNSCLTEKRKRVNPLYDGMTQSMPSIYSKTKDSKDIALQQQVRCLKCALIVLGVFSCASLALSLYALVTYTQTKDNADPVLTPKVAALSDSNSRLEESLSSSLEDNNDTMKILLDLTQMVNMIDRNLSSKIETLQNQISLQQYVISNNSRDIVDNYGYTLDTLSLLEEDSNDTKNVLSDLIRKLNMIDGNLTAQLDNLQNQLVIQQSIITNNTQEIFDNHENFNDVVTSLNLTLQAQLFNISKQEGPKGPQGVANFSKCQYYNVSNNAAASELFPNSSPWTPTEKELQTNIALFAMCSVEGGTKHELQIQSISANKLQYRCECSGTVESEDRRLCYLHILSCPRESVSFM